MGEPREAGPPCLAIFDCDGVLVDSEPVSNRVLAEAASEAGAKISTEEAAEAFAGWHLDDIAAEIARRAGSELSANWVASFEARRAAEFAKGLDPIPGVGQALLRIRGAGIPICVASQASREKVDLVLSLSGLGEHFEPAARFSSRMVERGKPAPDLFLFVARSMQCAPARCVVVEDGILGARAAKQAGMGLLGFAPAGDGGLLAAEGATLFASMRDLPGLLGIG
ncbi:MAG: HAD-IA family hydrolase [Solirubrobacterales bacterium]